MSFLPFNTSYEAMVSPIQQTGNYFIMDSEQLVSNPFKSMRADAQNEFQKKPNGKQKMINVRNKVCENHYRNTQDNLERNKDRSIQKIHHDTSYCRFQIKLLKLDRRKADIEVRKRFEPEANFDYDDSQIVSSSRRLCADINTPYLEKRLRHPVRHRGIDTTAVTPAVAKARRFLKHKHLHREYEEALTERSQTSTTFHSRPSSKLRSTKSAPVVYDRLHKKEINSGTTLPAIDKSHRRQQSVRFGANKIDRGERLERTAEILNINVKNPRKVPTYDNDDSDDDFAEYEKVDLRAILFGKKKEEIKPAISVKKSEFSDSSDEEQEHEDKNVSLKDHLQSASSQGQSRVHLDLPHHKPNQPLTPELLHRQFATVQKKVNTFMKDFTVIKKKKHKKHWFELSSDEEEEADNKKMEESYDQYQFNVPQKSNEHKEAWEYIHGHQKGQHLEGTYKTEDLVLQQLTGMNVAKSKSIPLNSAVRAMRKTPTFKMRKVLEMLKANRSRFEEHEINELRRIQDGEGLEFGEYIDLSRSGQLDEENVRNAENVDNVNSAENNESMPADENVTKDSENIDTDA